MDVVRNESQHTFSSKHSMCAAYVTTDIISITMYGLF